VADFIGDMNFLDGRVTDILDGGFAVETEGGIAVRGRGPAVKGDRVRVGIRPERMVALPATRTSAANSAGGEVVTKMYLGDQIQIVARLTGGTDVIVREQRASADPALDTIHPGDEITINWDEAAPLLLGDPGRASLDPEEREGE